MVAATTIQDFESVDLSSGKLRRWLMPILSIAIVAVTLFQLRDLRLERVIALMPLSPFFWLVFGVGYFISPLSEWVIFNRLWNVPPRSFLILLRKRLSNDILLGYSGEAYFYNWARRNVPMAAAPFGVVKDVAILSAAVANIFTLVLLACCWPLLRELKLDLDSQLVAGSALLATIASLASMLLHRILFTLPRRELMFIAAVHLVRIVANLVMTALLWAMIEPEAPLTFWLLLATLRMLVSRLPLIPNKELIFASLAALLIGGSANSTALVTLVAGLTLAAHLVVGCVLGAFDLAVFEKKRE